MLWIIFIIQGLTLNSHLIWINSPMNMKNLTILIKIRGGEKIALKDIGCINPEPLDDQATASEKQEYEEELRSYKERKPLDKLQVKLLSSLNSQFTGEVLDYVLFISKFYEIDKVNITSITVLLSLLFNNPSFIPESFKYVSSCFL